MSRLSLSRRRQSGITMIGLLFWAVVLCSGALLAMKVFPALSEYRTVLSMVNKVAHGGGSTVPEIRAAFDRAAQIEYGVTSVTSKDLEITKENDQVVVSFAYDKEIELISPVYLVIKFKGQSK
ncbi:MAG TPA: DUF4845 domain-containing protein [Aquabacterium sp.]|nr:DUF4845 domain-containing protein [Aquabacterium sp.]